MTRKLALLACVVLGLAGANVMQVWNTLLAFLFTTQLPQTRLFFVSFWVWFPAALAAAILGFRGGYQLLTRGDWRSNSLTAFVALTCVVLRVEHHELGFSAASFALNLDFGSVGLGGNVLGFVLLWWLSALRRDVAPLAPEIENVRGRGAV
jgi:hypothetical protein